MDIGVLEKEKRYTKKQKVDRGVKKRIHTVQIIRRTLFLRPGQRVIDEGIVLAQAFEVAGLAARRADGGEGGSLLQGGRRCQLFGSFFLGREEGNWLGGAEMGWGEKG